MIDTSDMNRSTALFYKAREIQQLAQEAMDRATPGPRRDCAIARDRLAQLARLAAEASRG
ncbi:MAG: hypothetical protein U5M50_04050 [Sphingobium sp.]|nr:hypothetical protein [Sphingobium sp.]